MWPADAPLQLPGSFQTLPLKLPMLPDSLGAAVVTPPVLLVRELRMPLGGAAVTTPASADALCMAALAADCCLVPVAAVLWLTEGTAANRVCAGDASLMLLYTLRTCAFAAAVVVVVALAVLPGDRRA